MRFFVFFIFFFLSAFFSDAQNTSKEIAKVDFQIYSNAVPLDLPAENHKRITLSEEEISPTRKLLAYFLGTGGGTIIGWQIGMEIAGKKKVDRFPLGIAAGFIFATIPAIEGDNISLSFRTVYGDYKMGEMQSSLLQSSPQLNNLNLPYSITDDFQAGIGYELAFSGVINNWTIGTKIGYRTTSGKFEYSDTKREVYFVNHTRLLEIIEFVKYSVFKTKNLSLTLGLNLGAGRTMETRETKIALYDGEQGNYDDRSTSLNLFFGPELMANLLITKHLRMEAFGGYDSHIFTGLNTNINNFPENAGNVDWSGVRLGLGLGWTFNN